LKILYVIHQFFPRGYTGTERFVLDLAKQMRKMGHYVEVLTFGIEEENTGFITDGNLLYKTYDFQNIPVDSVKYLKNPDDVNVKILDDRIAAGLKRYILKEKFDLVHVAHPMRIGYSIKIAHELNLPVIMTLTDFWLICPRGILVKTTGELCNQFNLDKCLNECLKGFPRNYVHQRIDETAEIFKEVDCFVTATRFSTKMFEINGYSGMKMVKFGTDYNHVRPNYKQYDAGSVITLGYLSSLNPHKGAHILLKAFIDSKVNNIKLKIYGDSITQHYYYDELIQIAKNHKNIEFCGEYKYEDMPDMFNELDMIIVPSIWWENTPLVLLSSLAHRVPAIVTNLGGMTEVVTDGENGFTFEVGNVESLKGVLQKISADPAMLNDLKNKIQRPPRLEDEAFEYEKLYLNLVPKNPDIISR
jgi:glycosyltransferase involved in cell wall biosynthesis